MSDRAATVALAGAVGLLERALSYALGSLHLVTPAALRRPTPCAGWDLRGLLAHLDDSLLALHEAAAAGRVGPDGGRRTATPVADPVAAVRGRATRTLGAWTGADGGHPVVTVDGSPLTAVLVASTGAIEVAVHGWDIARSCGRDHPIPAALAADLLDLSPLFVTAADRSARFAAPVAVPPASGPGDRLVAFLGRDPVRDRPAGAAA
jgi:uncharacterized protein (TIGR03086 family)